MSTHIASAIVPPLQRTLGYAEALLADIPADRFAHMPHPKMNHPAFNVGHLALYPQRVIGMIGKDASVAAVPDGWAELFQAGAACVEQDGRYPAKDALVDAFLRNHRALAEALVGVDDEVFARENPIEGRMREVFPTIGIAATFMSGAHVMMHLGQISAWRRAIGLGSVM